MSVGTWRGLGTLVVLVAFCALVLWAYSGKRRSQFDEAALLPFADEPQPVVRSPQP
ncbi:MAG: cbb3-type cytochrome c oxidase subunit 3 [Pseudomonas sp.]|uniref:cbb3-type cytochrome oxidase subunit 3 n=1 Tax=Pseudomonas sp. TaxID=306 RepID=UPI00339A57EE